MPSHGGIGPPLGVSGTVALLWTRAAAAPWRPSGAGGGPTLSRVAAGIQGHAGDGHGQGRGCCAEVGLHVACTRQSDVHVLKMHHVPVDWESSVPSGSQIEIWFSGSPDKKKGEVLFYF